MAVYAKAIIVVPSMYSMDTTINSHTISSKTFKFCRAIVSVHNNLKLSESADLNGN